MQKLYTTIPLDFTLMYIYIIFLVEKKVSSAFKGGTSYYSRSQLNPIFHRPNNTLKVRHIKDNEKKR